MNQEELQKLYQQLQAVEERKETLSTAIESLEALPKAQQMLTPIAPGIYTKVDIPEKSTIFMNVGQDIVIEMSVEEALKVLRKQLEDAESASDEMLME